MDTCEFSRVVPQRRVYPKTWIRRSPSPVKQEGLRCLLTPMSLAAMRREVGLYTVWYNIHRPHMALDGRTPDEVYRGRVRWVRCLEPRRKWPHRFRGNDGGDKFQLAVSYLDGRKHLPIVELRRAA